MKAGNLGGAYKHNERVFETHSNKDIDTSRSHLNYELTDRDRSVSYERQIKGSLLTGEDRICPLLFDVQSNKDSSFKVIKVPESKSISLDNFDDVVSSLQFCIRIG